MTENHRSNRRYADTASDIDAMSLVIKGIDKVPLGGERSYGVLRFQAVKPGRSYPDVFNGDLNGLKVMRARGEGVRAKGFAIICHLKAHKLTGTKGSEIRAKAFAIRHSRESEAFDASFFIFTFFGLTDNLDDLEIFTDPRLMGEKFELTMGIEFASQDLEPQEEKPKA